MARRIEYHVAPARRQSWRFVGAGALMMVAATAGLGLAYFVVSGYDAARNAKALSESRARNCGANFRAIADALFKYADTHGEVFPPTLATLVSDGLITDPHVFVCPSGGDAVAQGATPSTLAADVLRPGHLSYQYRGGMQPRTGDPGQVLLTENPSLHQGYGHVLFGDGSVRLLSTSQIEEAVRKRSSAIPSNREDKPREDKPGKTNRDNPGEDKPGQPRI